MVVGTLLSLREGLCPGGILVFGRVMMVFGRAMIIVFHNRSTNLQIDGNTNHI